MKKLLPNFIFTLLVVITFLFTTTPVVVAQQNNINLSTGQVPDDSWVIDKEVTFVGKNAARSGLLLDWTLQDYKWASVSTGVQNPLIPFWVTIRNIVYALFVLFVIATAFILVTTRGRSLSAKRFLPRFIIVALLVTFSFSLLQFLYQITDGIQGFFLRTSPGVVCPPDCISQKDLFYWSWDYKDFIGLRKAGEANNESAYISLILTKLSALTYYVMIGILIIRKVILWFFIIVSPIFPLLLLYYPVRNTAKIWIGEFFRWLFYAPLFAVFLAGLVSLWKQNIPMRFLANTGDSVYPTAVNILLAGPQQTAAFNNSVNLTDTYALYLVALIMLWVVIILPFILLQIFLDYLSKLSFNESPGWAQMMTLINKRFPPSPPPIAPIPPGPATTGLARSLPFRNRIQIPKGTGLARDIPTATSIPTQTQAQTQTQRQQVISSRAEIQQLTNISIPTMRDIARFESARLQKDTQQTREISMMRENLEKIANPSTITNSSERERYSQMRESLIRERDLGSPMATSILKAAESISSSTSESSKESSTLREVLKSIGKPEVVNALQKEKYVELRERIEKESQAGNTTAQSILNAINNASKSTTSITDTSAIKEIVRQLVNPEAVADASSRQQVVSLKEQLLKEKDSSSLAKEVLTTVEKVTSSATKEEKEQQISLLREKLLQEANKGNDTASALLSLIKDSKTTSTSSFSDTATIKEMIRQLSNPEKITNTENQQQAVSLKEKLIKEKETNTLAKEVLTTIEKITSSATQAEKDQQITLLKEKLLQEANKGNDTATALLNLVKHEDSSEDVTSLIEKLAKAKASGDPLAASVLQLLAEKEAEKQVTTIASVKKGDIPVSNRIQQVSLDDYEAVKDMWVDNYQNLDVPQSLEGEQSRKQWITEDMQQIEDTINLLSSTNEEDIQKGMEQVSSILPFLLIGGFSQAEITAYLKAKQEAGKEALKIVDITQSEDDTLLEVKKSTTQAEKTMTTSTQAAIPTPSHDFNNSGSQVYSSSTGSKINNSSISNDSTDYIESDLARLKPTNITININTQDPTQKVLSLTGITLPKMLEIAKYEAALRRGANDDSLSKNLLGTISGLANPNSITDPVKRQQASALRENLIKESQTGNLLASSILSAAGVIDKEKAGVTGDLGPIISLIKKLFDPTIVKNPTDREKYLDLKKKIELATNSGNQLAQSISQILKNMAQDYIFSVHNMFEELKNPANISNPALKDQRIMIKEMLLAEQRNGNLLAAKILKAIQNPVTIESILVLKTDLIAEKEKSEQLVTQILNNFPSVPAIDVVLAQNIKNYLQKGVTENDPFALYIQDFLLRKDDIKDKEILLPESNKIQQVSLEDYESVKKLWIDNYRHAEDKDMMDQDEAIVTEAINLLASPDKQKVELGMDKVSTILPFLLIGGFSQAEVVSYLKAKLEAIRTIRQEMAKDDTLQVVNQSSAKTEDLKKEQEIEPENNDK